MKNPYLRLSVVSTCILAGEGSLHASELAHEPFDYPSVSTIPLTDLNEGTGWASGWRGDTTSQPVSNHSPGLSYKDAAGNELLTWGWAASTADSQGRTTRMFRTLAGDPLNDVWISFVWHLGGSNSLFEGISFYRGTTDTFAVTNPSTTSSSSIHLVSAGLAPRSTGLGNFGTTHFIVLRLAKGAGANESDLAEIFIDPLLSGTPSQPHASVTGANFDFDTIRIAAQNGALLYFDEFRVGTTYASVTPHDPAPENLDSDGDGLTNLEEAVLGTDPYVSDAGLFAAIRSHPHLFGLYDAAGILQQNQGGVILPKVDASPVGFSFEIQQSENLVTWPEFETINRSVELPGGKNFLRVTLQR